MLMMNDAISAVKWVSGSTSWSKVNYIKELAFYNSTYSPYSKEHHFFYKARITVADFEFFK